jgi:transposase
MSRVELLSGPERRRRWSTEQKRSVVAEAFAPGASVCEVARRLDVVPGQIYRWRQELRTVAAGFAEVVVAAEPSEGSRTGVPALEIELGRDIRVRIREHAAKAIVRIEAAKYASPAMKVDDPR